MNKEPKQKLKQSKGYRTQMISKNTNQVFKKKARTIQNINIREDLEWEFHMKLIHMYSNILTFKSDSEEEEKYFNSIKNFMTSELYWNGVIGVSKYETKYGIFTLNSDIKKSVDGFVSSAQCKGKFSNDTKKITAGKDGAFLQYDQYQFPIFVGLDYWKDKIINLQELLRQDTENSIATLLFFYNKEDLKDETIVEKWSDIKDTSNGLIKLMIGKPIDKQEIKASSSADNIIKTINFYWNQMLNFRGFQTNVSQKESGVSQDEMNINLEQIGTVMESYIQFWEKFCQDINSSYGTKLSVQKIEFIDKNKGDKNEKNNSDNNELSS